MLLSSLQIVTVIIVSLAMALALAHALELPGKMRLSKEVYFAVQRIYYPGFTIAGISEPVGVILLVAPLFISSRETVAFWLTLVALIGLIGMQIVYWALIHPVNKIWVQGEALGSSASAFFSFGRSRIRTGAQAPEWKALRNRWEYAHLARAGLAALRCPHHCQFLTQGSMSARLW